MTVVLVEPSCYVFGGSSDTTSATDCFYNDFWPTFVALKKGVELNDVTFPLSDDLRNAVENVFPYGAIERRGGVRRDQASKSIEDKEDEKEHANPDMSVSILIRFLERRAQAPLFTYQ